MTEEPVATIEMSTTRRRFLVAAGVAATGGILGACTRNRAASPEGSASAAPGTDSGGPVAAADENGFPPAIEGKDVEAFVFHDPGAPNAELKREFMGASLVTPYERFFVRNNLPVPNISDGAAFAVTVEGVARPGVVTVAELRQLPWVVVPAVLQCSGNGRALFPEKTSGSPWSLGAAGMAFWAGVPISVLADRFGGPAARRRFLTITGSEKEAGDKARVERSIPIEKGLRDVLLALEMNGAPLPLAHGGPVRLVVPGYYGINWVKYPQRLAFTEHESDAPIMTTTYRIAPPGGTESPDQETCWAMNVKSWITAPLDGAMSRGGALTVRGVAFAGERSVRRVDVTVDGGSSWVPAQLVGPDLGPTAWRQFEHTFDARPGTYTLASRATDAAATTQPEEGIANAKGQRANGWRGPAVELVIS